MNILEAFFEELDNIDKVLARADEELEDLMKNVEGMDKEELQRYFENNVEVKEKLKLLHNHVDKIIDDTLPALLLYDEKQAKIKECIVIMSILKTMEIKI